MHFTLAAVLLLAAADPVPPAVDDAQIAKGLRNLAQIHAVAQVLELRRTARVQRAFELPPDAWGKPFRLEGERILSAGSDGLFEYEPPPNEQFAGVEGDLIFGSSGLQHSNRNWLYARMQPGSDSAAALLELRTAEVQYMLMRQPTMRNLMIARLTAMEMQRPGATADGWGTPLKLDGTRIISAGADLAFDPESWTKAPALDLKEDIIVEAGAVTRSVDAAAYLRATTPYGMAVPQPPDPQMNTSYERVFGGEVQAPVAITRVEPKYSEDYRRARISGIVILEAAILADGAIESVRVLKSCAPDLDMAAVEAVRQWTFEPAKRNGQAIPALFNLTINFKLK
jgi:TonB family protein